MKTKSFLRVIPIALVLALLPFWEAALSAQPGSDMMPISSQSSPTSAMAISPDSKYLYLFVVNRIYQFELPALNLMNTIDIVMPDTSMPQSGRKMDLIRDFDKDLDGRVSKEEFHGPRQVFERIDRNNDGYIDRNEVP